METYEFEGKTTEEAIETASRKLNLPVEELDIDVIEPGSAGIFGLVGGRKAKIKVIIKGEDTVELKDVETADIEMEDIEMEDVRMEDVRMEDVRMEDVRMEDVRMEDVEENGLGLARQTLEDILALIPVETTVSSEKTDGQITLNIEGDKSGLLIGRKGKTLDALQFIVNKIVSKNFDKKMSITVDSENYRKRRKESLVQLALKMGDKAKRIKKPVVTNPLNPHDRRIIHLTLKEDENLDTKSRGEGIMKKMVIIPKS